MGSPEEPHEEEDKMINSPEGKKELQTAIHTLREVAKQFRALDNEAKVLIRDKGDASGYTEKLKSKAQLLIDLRDRLASSLEGVDQETKQQILREVSYFATAAQEALESGGFSLGALLTHRGKLGDKNDLEKLIDSLESR